MNEGQGKPSGCVSFNNISTCIDFRIYDWLQGLGLSIYSAQFAANDLIDADVVAALTDEDLKSIGIASLGHRKKILINLPVVVTSPSTPLNKSNDSSPSRKSCGSNQSRYHMLIM